jgi:uncharacterized membrane protein
MGIRLRHIWERLRTSYWFVPAVMLVLSVVLAYGLLYVDRVLITSDMELSWLYGCGPEGARTVLATIGGSVITVAGVVFSITIAALTQASQQFGPRLLRNFMRDRANQIVLGTFVATFLYSLLVLRTIVSEDEGGASFVPQASVTAGVVLAAASIVVLIYFIHHVSISLQAPSVVAAVGDDLRVVIERLPRDQNGTSVPVDAQPPAAPPEGAMGITATVEGYVQAINFDELSALAERTGSTIWLDYRPGHYVLCGSRLARVAPPPQAEDEFAAAVNDAFFCGARGTPEQDVEFAIRQLVEVAVRALSPGVNDPFTAVNCIDALGSAVCRLARRGLPGPHRYDKQGAPRLVVPVTTLPGAIDAAFDAIRQYGRESVPVIIRLIDTLAACAAQMTTEDARAALRRQLEIIARQSEGAITEPEDLAEIRRRIARASDAWQPR